MNKAARKLTMGSSINEEDVFQPHESDKTSLSTKLISSNSHSTINSRRNFLKLGAVVGASAFMATLPGCSTFDEWLFGDGLNTSYKNIVLGAGASGLYASYLLKQQKQDFLLLEGSRRVGGRCYTLNPFLENGQILELGAEWISVDDKTTLALIKELKINLVEYQNSGRMLSFASARIASCILAVRKMSARFSKDQQLKLPSRELSNWAELRNFSKELEQLYMFAVQTYGYDLNSLNLYHLLQSFRHPLLQGVAYKLGSGSSELMQTLFDRVVGVVVNKNARLGYQLIGIEREADKYLLTFQTDRGEKTLKAENVISSIPPVILKGIPGFETLNLSERVRAFFVESQSAKMTKGGYLIADRKNSVLSQASGTIVAARAPMQGILYEGSLPPVISMAKSPQVIGFQGSDVSVAGLTQGLAPSSVVGFHEQQWHQFPWARGGWNYSPQDPSELFQNQSAGWQFIGDYTQSMRPSVEAALKSVKALLAGKV